MRPFALALNRLLDADPDGRARLARHGGKSFELAFAPLPAIRLAVTADGRVDAAYPAAAPTVSIRPRKDALRTVLSRARPRAGEVLHAEGDAEFAETLFAAFDSVPWMLEELTSRLTGDVIARQIGAATSAFVDWQRDTAARLFESLGAWVVEERAFLTTRGELAEHAVDVQTLAAAVERLRRRTAVLEAGRTA